MLQNKVLSGSDDAAATGGGTNGAPGNESVVVVKECRNRKCWCKCCLALLVTVVLVIAAVVAYFGYAFRAYHAVKPRDLACAGNANTTTSLDGFNLYTRLLGTNTTLPPLVIIHGGPGHSSESFKGSLDRLAQHRRVLFYDQRGSGLSQMKAEKSAYNVQNLVVEIDHLRSSLLQADRIIVLAHSSGGAVAQHYAATYPSNLQALILVESTKANNDMSQTWVWRVLGPGLYGTALGFPPKNPDKADQWFFDSGNKDDMKRLYNPAKNATILESTGPIRFSTWFSVSQVRNGYD